MSVLLNRILSQQGNKLFDSSTALKFLTRHRSPAQKQLSDFRTVVKHKSTFNCTCLQKKEGVSKVFSLFSSRNISEGITGGGIVVRRVISTTSKRDAIPPVVLVVVSRVAKFGAMLAGRAARRWWQKLPPEEKAAYVKRARRNRYVISGVVGGLALGSFIYYDTHIQETPFTKRRRFLAFTEAQFNDMAKYELEMLLTLYKEKIIPATMNLLSYRRVVHVAQRLLKANKDLPQFQNKDWTITVVDDDSHCNAFVLPCGSVFVFSGLLKLCESDDELAVILGHEMAHAVMGHGAEKASFLHFLDMCMVLPLAAIWAILPTDITAALCHWIASTVSSIVMELPHSRFIEQEADEVGLILTAKACYDIREAPTLWSKMALAHPDIQIEWLSTHPNHENRESKLEELIPVAIKVRDQCHCPRLPHFDPRRRIEDYKKRLDKNKPTHEGLMIPVKIV